MENPWQNHWLRRGRQVALRVNAARFLGLVAPATALLAVMAGCAVLLARRGAWDLLAMREPAVLSALGTLGLLGIFGIALAGWRRVRRHPFTAADGLVRLEAVLNLHNRLSSAAQGVGSWPAPSAVSASPGDGFRWRWGRLAGPPFFGAAFLATALLLPISRESGSTPFRVETPLAWEQVAAALEEIRREEAADPEALAAMEEKLDSLRSQPVDSWYSQGSLEAGDALRQEAANAVASLERHLDSAMRALSQARGADGQNSAQALPPSAAAEWEEALKGLSSGALPLGPTELGKLRGFDPSAAGALSSEQLQQIQEALSRKASAAGEAHRALGNVNDALAQHFQPGEGQEEGDGGVPSGEPGPGGGHPDLNLKQAPTALEPGKEEAVGSDITARTEMGDVLARSAAAPEADPAREAPVGPGNPGGASAGAGGEAVWKNGLSPSEREVLRRFFK